MFLDQQRQDMLGTTVRKCEIKGVRCYGPRRQVKNQVPQKKLPFSSTCHLRVRRIQCARKTPCSRSFGTLVFALHNF